VYQSVASHSYKLKSVPQLFMYLVQLEVLLMVFFKVRFEMKKHETPLGGCYIIGMGIFMLLQFAAENVSRTRGFLTASTAVNFYRISRQVEIAQFIGVCCFCTYGMYHMSKPLICTILRSLYQGILLKRHRKKSNLKILLILILSILYFVNCIVKPLVTYVIY
jgi:hypothetical protein